MCSVCMMSACPPGCPNSEEQEPVYTCGRCGYGIFPGDHFIETGDGYICRECLEDMSIEESLEIFGVKLKTAEKEE